MQKKYYAAKLIGPRATFPQDMTDTERAIMQRHIAYTQGFMDKGKVVVFGPVFDSAAVYGLGIFCVETEDELKEILSNDPAAGIGRCEYYPMMAVVPKTS